jgi:phage tail-like protein
MTELSAIAGIAGQVQGIADSLTVGMSHHYAVLIDNVKYHFGDWSRASGLSVTWQQLEHREGENGNDVVYLPGATKYEPITLSRAAGPYSRMVQHWLSETSRSPQPQSGTIQLVNFLGLPMVQWRLSEFFPIGWSIESFDAAGAKPAIETLKLAHTGFLEDAISMLSPI